MYIQQKGRGLEDYCPPNVLQKSFRKILILTASLSTGSEGS